MKVVILGAGGHAREIADIVDASSDHGVDVTVLGYLDDDPSRAGSELNGRPVLGGLSWLEAQTASDVRVISGVGHPATRRKMVERARDQGASFCTLIHPTASLTKFVELGPGVVISAGCVLTNKIRIGSHSHVNRMTTVGHDCRVGEYVHLAPGVVLSGNVTIGDGCDIGTNACVIQNVSVGAWAIVGAGAVVTRDLRDGVTAVGVPARPKSAI